VEESAPHTGAHRAAVPDDEPIEDSNTEDATPEASIASPARRISLRTLLIAGLGALILGIAIGVAVGDPPGSVDKLNTAEALLKSRANKIQFLQSKVDDRDARASAMQAKINDYQAGIADIEAQKSTLAQKEAELAEREKAVSSAETRIAANTFPGEGIYIVGTDVQPGRYRSDGGSGCYWARMNANGDDIIDNDISDGPTVVTIQPTDGIIKVSRCGPFTKVG